ncbi:MAG: hypothetical protein CSB33_01325 [Desulfobacterales bacterium]|nr:MAG: hypothetical protein CSB33_01325 [Desulfobacterales bacterium]
MLIVAFPSRFRFFPFLGLLLLCCAGWTDSWESIQVHCKAVSAVSAEFTQEKHLAILQRPLVSRGKFVFRSPNSLRWEYTEPVHGILLMDRGAPRRIYDTGDGLKEDDSVSMEAMGAVLSEISLWLGGRFADHPRFTAGLKPGGEILLTPRNEGMKTMIRSVTVRLSDTPGLIQEVEIWESPEARTRIIFSNAEINPNLPDDIFRRIP